MGDDTIYCSHNSFNSQLMKILKYILNHIYNYNRYKEELRDVDCYVNRILYDLYINSSATLDEMKQYKEMLLDYSKFYCKVVHAYYANNTRLMYYLKNKIDILKLNFEHSYIWVRSEEPYILSSVEFNEEYIKIIKLYRTNREGKTYICIYKDDELIELFLITLTIDELFDILYKI